MVRDPLSSLALKDAASVEASRETPLFRQLPYVTSLNDAVLLLSDGDVMGTLRIEGLSAAMSDDRIIEALRSDFASIVQNTGGRVAYYIHRVSAPERVDLTPVKAPEFASALDRVWRDHLDRQYFRHRAIYLTVLVRPAFGTRTWSLFSTGAAERSLEERRNLLEEVMKLAETSLSRAGARRLRLDSSGEWLGLLSALTCGEFGCLAPPRPGEVIAKDLPVARVTFRGDWIQVHGLDGRVARYGAMFALKRYGGESEPGMFDAFDLDADLVVTQSFTPISNNIAADRVKLVMRQMRAADDAAFTLLDQLSEASDDLESGRVIFGEHHMTVAAYASSLEELDAIAAEIRNAGQQAGGVTVVREDMFARAAYFAQHPGNYGYRARAALVSSRNFADMAAFHGQPRGRTRDETPLGEVMTVFPTITGELYRFNLHRKGASALDAEPTPGHAVVIGATGSGKTATTAFLMTQALRAGVRLIVFDKDHGLEMPVRALGGRYTTIRMGQAPGLNPLATEVDERGIAWLADWLSALLERDVPLSAIQSKALAEAVRENAKSPAGMRRMSIFDQQFRGIDDDRDLEERFQVWVRGDATVGSSMTPRARISRSTVRRWV